LRPAPKCSPSAENSVPSSECANSIEEKRKAAARQVKPYPHLDALKRSRRETKHLSDEQARHLTTHAVIRNE